VGSSDRTCASYLRCYESAPELERGLRSYVALYNHERPHQSLAYSAPAELHDGGGRRE